MMNTINKTKTHCLRGHEFSQENTRVFAGRRYCLECRRIRKKRRRANNPEIAYREDRESGLRKNYGISGEQFNAMENEQRGVCAICKSASLTRRLDVDHDHKTGSVRGLLCTRCNRGLGYFRDDARLLNAAKNYIIEFNYNKESAHG